MVRNNRSLRGGRGDEQGFVTIFVAGFLVALVGFASLVVDLGQLIVVRSELQNAADAGAIAGVIELVYNGTDAAEAAAADYATLPGHFNLNRPAPSADAVNVSVVDADTIQVRIRRGPGTTAGAVPTFFAPIWGVKTAEVAAVATATANRRIIGTGPGNLMPIALHKSLVDRDGDGAYDVGSTIELLDKNLESGTFGLLDLSGHDSSDEDFINWIKNGFDDNFVIPEDPGYSDVEGDTGSWLSKDSFEDALIYRLGDRLLFPVYDQIIGSGDHSIYRVIDFVGAVIKGLHEKDLKLRIVEFSAPNLLAGSALVPPNASVFKPILIQ